MVVKILQSISRTALAFSSLEQLHQYLSSKMIFLSTLHTVDTFFCSHVQFSTVSKEYNKPNIVARMQEHSMAFSYCVENNDIAGALIKIQQLNMDLPKDDRIIVGHGIDKASIPKGNNPEDLKKAKLIDADCPECKLSTLQVDMHTPFQAISGQERLHLRDNHFEWLTQFSVLVEARIAEVGYKRGWWRE